MTLIEHYLRTNFNILPDSQLIKELLNYLQDRGYEVDMPKMISESNSKEVLYLRRPDGDATIIEVTEDIDEDEEEYEEYFIIEEREKVNNPESPFYNQDIETSVDISTEKEIPTIGITIEANKGQMFIEFGNIIDSQTFEGGTKSNLSGKMGVYHSFKLDDINGMVQELSNRRLLLTFAASSTRKALENCLQKGKQKEITK